MKWQNLIAGTAAVFMLASGAFAADGAKTAKIRGDSDGSGSLSPMEMLEERDSFFMTIDGDKDGKIRIEEFIAYLTKDFEARDTNKDGVLMADEFVVYWCGKGASPKAVKTKSPKASQLKGNMLKLQDKNSDGILSQDECVTFWSMRFGAADTNKDGKVTKDEFMRVMKQAAKRIDANKDGFITVEEYRLYWTGASQSKQKAKQPSAK